MNAPPSMAEISAAMARIRHLGVVELRLGDDWRARWEPGDSLPPGVPAIGVFAVFYAGDKGYVFRRPGEQVWGTIEITPADGQQPAAAVRAASKPLGITPSKVILVGYFDCRATSHNKSVPAESRAVLPFYAVAAKSVKDTAAGAPYERRRLPLNEHITAMRSRYPEFELQVGDVADRYLVLRARGEV